MSNSKTSLLRLVSMQISSVFLFAIIILIPTNVFAATTYHLTCADFSLGGGATCSSDILSVNSSGSIATLSITFTTATWYGSWGATAGNYRYACIDGTSCGDNHVAGTKVDLPISFTTATQFAFIGDSSPVDLSAICLSDVSGDCEAGPPPPPPTPIIDFGNASTTIIADPNRDFFYGILIFFLSTWLVIYIFKKN